MRANMASVIAVLLFWSETKNGYCNKLKLAVIVLVEAEVCKQSKGNQYRCF